VCYSLKVKNKHTYRKRHKNGKSKDRSKDAPKTSLITGTLSVNMRQVGYVRIPDGKKSILIEPEDLATALHGDTVSVEIYAKRHGREDKGRIKKIIERAKVGFSGKLSQKDSLYFLHADDLRLYKEIVIPKNNLDGAKIGDKIFVEITSWTDSKEPPIGKVLRVLGKPGNMDAEMHGIALERGFDSTFPKYVEDEAQRLYEKPMDLNSRKDMRGIPTMTIDPEDAKDFDDALSIRELPDKTFEIGIHIADVSHYVRPGNALDKEAFRRGTSVYLVDRTIPMLPEVLSNDLCSLKPNVDRLAMSVVGIFEKNGKLKDTWFGRTVIHSDKRFSYEEAQEVLEKGEGTFHTELSLLKEIGDKLFSVRKIMGTISLEQDEVKFKLDKDGRPIEVYRKIRKDAHRMIEEWMLFANRKVAEIFRQEEKKGGVGVYRIHDLPNQEKMVDLVYILERLGYSIPKGHLDTKKLDAIMEELINKPERDMITSMLIRSMAKAVYSTNNIGHFGLGFKDYTHFTSPIRRYPDIMVHRLLDEYMTKKKIPKITKKEYERISIYSSERERNAADAERASVKLKQVEYMSERIGEIFEATITGIIERGIFVEEKQSKSEGMIQISALPDGPYSFIERELKLVSSKTKKEFKLADTIKVKVVAVDLERKDIQYELI
jgi:ribonuclease R